MNERCKENPHGERANVQDCEIVIGEFELQSRYYVHIWTNISGKDMKPLLSIAIGKKVQLRFLYKDDFGIK